MPSKRTTYTYSYEDAQQKLATLAENHYNFIGSITGQLSKRPLIRSAQFLVKKEHDYYQYKAEYLFAHERSAQFSDIQKDLIPVVNQEYIYVILHRTSDNLSFIILRENTAISGHDFLVKPYKQHDYTMMGGELFFYDRQLLLINNKSGSFQTTAAEAIGIIGKVFTQDKELFYPAVEKIEVDAEIARRRLILSVKELATVPVSRPQTLFYQRPASPVVQQTHTTACACTIL